MRPNTLKVLICTLPFLGLLLSDQVNGQEEAPVLEFPQTGLDDTAAYQGYLTRFFRDTDGNTVQIVINQLTGRIVNLWADAADESVSLTVRDSHGRPEHVEWLSSGATVSNDDRKRSLQYALASESPVIDLGLFLLGSMRKERDFQYLGKDRLPFGSEEYIEEPYLRLLENMEHLDGKERDRQLTLLKAGSLEELRSRLAPSIVPSFQGGRWQVDVTQRTFDGKNELSLRISDDTTSSRMNVSATSITVQSLKSTPVRIIIRITTDSPSLTPIGIQQIFSDPFLRKYHNTMTRRDQLIRRTDSTIDAEASRKFILEAARLERQTKSIGLLSYKEKLMAGLPNYATYFGRDMMMSAMMMQSILRPGLIEYVIENVLRKMSPVGRVSHEESLGCQAIRENAEDYNRLIAHYFTHRDDRDSASAQGLLVLARRVLGKMQRVRENYGMEDEDFQLPVLVGRYLASQDIGSREKRLFLTGKINGESRLTLILRNLIYVSRLAEPFTVRRDATSLVSFSKLDDNHWRSGSWRDSGAGYANGRFGMDINAIWVPNALQGIRRILLTLNTLGYGPADIDTLEPAVKGTFLERFFTNPSSLDEVIEKWSHAKDFFVVDLPPDAVQKRIELKLAWLPPSEAMYWRNTLALTDGWNMGIRFMALSLDSVGNPIPVVNTDPATGLFLDNFYDSDISEVGLMSRIRDLVDPFIIPYPVGLYVKGLGPLVANDAYASREVWDAFQNDHYHSPRVVWGREVNLILLGLCKQINAVRIGQGKGVKPAFAAYAVYLRKALTKVRAAVEESGMKHNELWSYRISEGKLVPSRYASSCDIQLWNLTDLAVQFELDLLPK